MLAEKIIKSIFFRGVASFLLVVSLAMLGSPEANTYSQAKIFIKSPVPQSLSYFSVSTDDIEDSDEDGAIDVQVVSDILIDSSGFPWLGNSAKSIVKAQTGVVRPKAFLRFGQLLIWRLGLIWKVNSFFFSFFISL